MNIKFFKPYITGSESEHVQQVIESGGILSDGVYTKKCETLIKEITHAKNVIMTSSCTHALEMAVGLLSLEEGDEVLLPSFSFPSCATAIMQYGGVPVLVDSHPETLQMSISSIRERMTCRSKAIMVLHYGGNCCDMDAILTLANEHNLIVIEDAAQGFGSKYKGKHLGTIGHLGCYSFHGTKNIGCGEGGALLVNRGFQVRDAMILRDKGTNRQAYLKGETDFYQWVGKGSSYVPSELQMAYLYGQIIHMNAIQKMRKEISIEYEGCFKKIDRNKILGYTQNLKDQESNDHIFYINFKTKFGANSFREYMLSKGIETATHFVPLHESKMGKEMGYKENTLIHAYGMGDRVVRLPLYPDLVKEEVTYICQTLEDYFQPEVGRVAYG